MKEHKYKNIIIATLILLTIPFISRAQGYSLQDCTKFTPDSTFIAKLDANNKLKELRCDFKEIKHISILTQDALSYGTFTLKNGDMTLEYTKPKGKVITIGQEKFTVIENGKKSEIGMNANPLMRQFKGMLGATIGGNIDMFGKESDIEYFTRKNEYVVIITPSDKRTNRHLYKIVLAFDRNDMTLNELTMFENSSDYTQYLFTNKSKVL